MICRLCLDKSTVEVLNIFDAEGIRLQIADIISRHFWFTPLKDDPISDIICCSCWTKVNNFHEFYCYVENAHKNLINFTDSSNIKLSNVKQEHIFTSDSDDDINNALDINIVEGFEIVLDKQNPIADIKVNSDEDTKVDIALENNCSKAKNLKKSNKSSHKNQCDNEKNKQQLEENSIINEGTAKNKNTRSKKSENSKQIQKKSCSVKKLEKEGLDSDDDDEAVIEENANTSSIIPKSSRKRLRGKSPKQQKKKTKKKKLDMDDGDDDDDENDSKKLAQKKKTEEEDEQIAKYVKMDCDVCKTNFKTFTELTSHIKKEHHKKNGYVKCCNKKLFRRSDLLDHVNFHINPDAFICKICNRRFKSVLNLKCHFANQHGGETSDLYSCDQCEKKFTNQFMLDSHLKIHLPPEEQFKCNFCDKQYPSENTLKYHVRRIHERAFELVCDICAKRVRCKSLLEQHKLEKHDGVKEPKAQCPECGIWIKKASYMRKHMRLHNEPLYKCEFCGRQATRRDSIIRHIKSVHENQRDFKCTVCEKAFKRKQVLIEHMTTHTGDTLYTCTFCPQTFNSNANMYSHRKKVHPKEWEELNKQRMNPVSETASTLD